MKLNFKEHQHSDGLLCYQNENTLTILMAPLSFLQSLVTPKFIRNKVFIADYC